MTYTEQARHYAESVVSGDRPACVHVVNACKRFLSDLTRDDIELDNDAERWCTFLERLPHVKGRWASTGERLILSDWQVFVTVNIYGWKDSATKLRRFREAYIEVPRKNGKSFWVAGLGVGALTIEREHGAEVYCGATSEAQAWFVFRPAKQICERMPQLREAYGVEVNAKTLNVLSTGSVFQPVIGNPGDGASPSCAIADEFHEHRTSDLVDTFITGMGAREQPLMIYITTAGSDMGGPCYQKRGDVVNILSGAVVDDSVFGIIYTIDQDDDWQSEYALVKANPNYGVSVDGQFLRGQMEQARRSSTKQAAFKTKHLNCWVGAKAAWMNMLAFQACRRKSLSIDDFAGRQCIVSLDLASKRDIACMAVLFLPTSPGGKYAAFVRHYLPEDTVLEGGNTRYKDWHAGGWLTATPGNVTDFEFIEDDLDDIKSRFQIVDLPYDPFQATQFVTRLSQKGYPVIEYGATVRNFSEPMKQLEALILEKKIEFEMDPVLLWMFGNVVARIDKKNNIFPDKEFQDAKTDGVVALIMAMGRALSGTEAGSVYDERGLRFL